MATFCLDPDEFTNLRLGLNISAHVTLATLLPEFRQRRWLGLGIRPTPWRHSSLGNRIPGLVLPDFPFEFNALSGCYVCRAFKKLKRSFALIVREEQPSIAFQHAAGELAFVYWRVGGYSTWGDSFGRVALRKILRRRMRALWSCDLDVPMEQPSACAIS